MSSQMTSDRDPLIAVSRADVPVRLTSERWAHIVEEHCELAGLREEVLETVAAPECVYQGVAGELLAVRTLSDRLSLVVVYREISADDGFIITAFVTSRPDRMARRPRIWPRQS